MKKYSWLRDGRQGASANGRATAAARSRIIVWYQPLGNFQPNIIGQACACFGQLRTTCRAFWRAAVLSDKRRELLTERARRVKVRVHVLLKYRFPQYNIICPGEVGARRACRGQPSFNQACYVRLFIDRRALINFVNRKRMKMVRFDITILTTI